jgi:hypothetical protein
MITAQSDFEDETAWERTVLERAIPMMPLRASGTGYLDLRTRNITTEVSSIIDTYAVEELRNALLPLLFGAVWKITDLALERAFALAGLTPQNGRRWRIDEKAQRAAAHSGNLPGFASKMDVWQALGLLYNGTIEVRHALIHRRVRADPSTRDLTAFDPNGNPLPPLSYNEQMAFCRFAQRIGQAIIEGALRPRVEADLQKQLADLQRHHGVAVRSTATTRPPVRVIDDLPANGQLDIPHILGEAQTTFPGAQYVDLELHLEDGWVLSGWVGSFRGVRIRSARDRNSRPRSSARLAPVRLGLRRLKTRSCPGEPERHRSRREGRPGRRADNVSVSFREAIEQATHPS